ncbi:C-type lectin domain family 2 member E-like [Sphaerodactylus townsendi]|uniref:C-type lectin domain family 2 member E-like n=1 Tax=Sphaerodactylus townsendi TaxID=933632 RepID=UPI00202766DF|nr:C-type lectin domain family 2 member E-like [Sphaerodactylus townsendi]
MAALVYSVSRIWLLALRDAGRSSKESPSGSEREAVLAFCLGQRGNGFSYAGLLGKGLPGLQSRLSGQPKLTQAASTSPIATAAGPKAHAEAKARLSDSGEIGLNWSSAIFVYSSSPPPCKKANCICWGPEEAFPPPTDASSTPTSALTVLKKPCPALPTCPVVTCPDGWVGYQGKCYYFAKAERNWTSSKMHCSSLNASLAVIDSQEEMDFIRRYKGPADHWIGLQRILSQPWKWINGTTFNNWFTILGGGNYAYMNEKSFASSDCSREEPWICSKLAVT